MRKPDLLLSVKNVSEVESVYAEPSHYGGQPDVLVRDKNNNPVALTDAGVTRIWEAPMEGRGFCTVLSPGQARGFLYPLGSNYEIDEAGLSTVLATFSLGSDSTLVAGPTVVPAREKQPGIRGEPNEKPPGTDSSKDNAQAARGTDHEWSDLMAHAGKIKHGCLLETTISPYSPTSVHLVVSLIYVQRDDRQSVRKANSKWPFGFFDPAPDEIESEVTVNAGRAPASYRVIIRDARGNLVDLTDFGRKCFANREKEWPYSLRLGDAMGTWFPLDEMFSLKSRDEYTVLVVLRGIQQTQGDIVSAPLKIRVPELQIAGINRPLYGSDRLWQRFAIWPRIAAARTGPNAALRNTTYPVCLRFG